MPARPRHCIGRHANSKMPLVPIGAGKAKVAARSQETTLVRATLTALGGGLVAPHAGRSGTVVARSDAW
jgi:hypothetical protein